MTTALPSKSTVNSDKLFNGLSVLLSIAFSLFVAEFALSYFNSNQVSEERMDPGMILYDAQLGWKLKPGWSGNHHHLDYDVRYTINKDGFRGRVFSQAENSYAVVGDSFSFGLGVNDDETFTALLNNEKNSPTEFYNFSVPGYSTDQQLLLINKRVDKISANTLLVVYLGNDIFDNMRNYPLQAEHGKPYYALYEGTLQLKNTPVPLKPKPAAARKQTISSIVLGDNNQVSTFSAWLANLELSRRLNLFQVEPVLTNKDMQERFSEPLKLLSALIGEINENVKENGGQLSVVLLPGKSYVEQQGSLSAQYQEYFREVIQSQLSNSQSINVIDAALHLRTIHNSGVVNLYHPNEGHLTVSGHRYVAEFLYKKVIGN